METVTMCIENNNPRIITLPSEQEAKDMVRRLMEADSKTRPLVDGEKLTSDKEVEELFTQLGWMDAEGCFTWLLPEALYCVVKEYL